MRCKLKTLLISSIFMSTVWANPWSNAGESSISEVRNESEVLNQYSGIVGTAPKHETVSSAGTALEFLPNGTNFFGFFSQTLANDIYYEVRLYSRYNYITANPNIPGIPASNEAPPMGYGATGILGYNFHPTDQVDLTPYIRFNAYNNMGPVYNDSNGDFLTSNTYAFLIGGKLSFKATPVFSPYINIWGGFQTNDLVGAYPNSATQSNTPISGVLNQVAINYEIGLGMRLAEHITLIPYWQYATTLNHPDATAATAIDQGGLNQSNLTGIAQSFGLKLSMAW